MEKLRPAEEQILELFFTRDIEKIENTPPNQRAFYNVFRGTYIISGKLVRVPYHFISMLVYSSSESYEEQNEFLLANLDYVKRSAVGGDLVCVEQFNKKVLDHYQLVKEQKKYLDENIVSINGEIERFQNDIRITKEIVDASKLENDNLNKEMRETKDKLYSEFVAILGIFSALMFGLFGGFEGLAASITTLATSFNIGKTIMVSAAIFIALTAFVYALVQWVGRIIGKPLSSCNCSVMNNCGHSFFERNRSFIIIVLIELILFLIGFLTLISRITGIASYFRSFNQGWLLFGTAFIITIALTGVVARMIFTKSKKAYNNSGM